jgi:Asp-tRNA(Asn)/Glu-tRNA(Gln) amidotransferase A subunit family amidase
MTDESLCYLSATKAIAAFKSKELSPVELMQAVVDRAEAVNPTINAFTFKYFERAMQSAKTAEARYVKGNPRALEGIPLVIKDETSLKGHRTTSGGSLVHKDHIDTETAISAQRIQRAGAIIHGRSTAPEFSSAGVTHSKLWGVTRNPWNPEFTPGGSSGGAAAQLAAGTTTLANGSDIGGSIRIPASCSGVVGFKPPYGRVPQRPPFNLDSYCHEGPLARSVADCALFQNVLAGPHNQDIVSLRPKLKLPASFAPIGGWKIAYSIDLGYVDVDDEVRANTLATLELFRELGATVEEVELGWGSQTLAAAMNHLGHLWGSTMAPLLSRHRYDVTNYVRAFGEFSRTTTAADFMNSMQVAGEMYDTLGPLLDKFNVFICPTAAVPAARADHDPGTDTITVNGKQVDPMLGWVMTYPFNILSRCPVLAVPSGRAGNRVPTGIQIVGRTYDDVSVFRAGAALETLRPMYDCADNRPQL